MAAMPNVLVILGSPRRGKTSEHLAACFTHPLIQAGAQVTTLRASALSVRPCTGCDSCRQTGSCVLKDDMAQVYTALDAADWVVLASPMYFNSVTGILKVLIDRCQIYWARKFVLKHQPLRSNRLGFLLMTAGVGQTPENLNGPWRVADYFFKAQDITPRAMLCHDRTDVGDEAHAQERCEAAEALAKEQLSEWLNRD